MIYITGDIHGDQNRWLNQIHPVLRNNDSIIVCGDFGVGLWDEKYMPEEMFYDFISEQNYSVYFLDGNHDSFDKLNDYPIVQWCGGFVRKLRHNIIHCMRGEIYNLEGNRIFTFGGGNSIDKEWRIQEESRVRKKLWWPEEMPSVEEYDRAKRNLKKINYKVDYILSHTFPKGIKSYFNYEGEDEFCLNDFLEDIYQNTDYKHGYFGHTHVDLDIGNQTAIYKKVRRLDTNKIVL